MFFSWHGSSSHSWIAPTRKHLLIMLITLYIAGRILYSINFTGQNCDADKSRLLQCCRIKNVALFIFVVIRRLASVIQTLRALEGQPQTCRRPAARCCDSIKSVVDSKWFMFALPDPLLLIANVADFYWIRRRQRPALIAFCSVECCRSGRSHGRKPALASLLSHLSTSTTPLTSSLGYVTFSLRVWMNTPINEWLNEWI